MTCTFMRENISSYTYWLNVGYGLEWLHNLGYNNKLNEDAVQRELLEECAESTLKMM